MLFCTRIIKCLPFFSAFVLIFFGSYNVWGNVELVETLASMVLLLQKYCITSSAPRSLMTCDIIFMFTYINTVNSDIFVQLDLYLIYKLCYKYITLPSWLYVSLQFVRSVQGMHILAADSSRSWLVLLFLFLFITYVLGLKPKKS